MPSSLKTKLSKLRFKGEITNEEYQEIIKKLAGHDSRVREDERNKTIEEFKKRFTCGLAEAVRCAMCKNTFANDKGCDGNCEVNESMYKRVVNAIDVAIKYAEWMKEGTE